MIITQFSWKTSLIHWKTKLKWKLLITSTTGLCMYGAVWYPALWRWRATNLHTLGPQGTETKHLYKKKCTQSKSQITGTFSRIIEKLSFRNREDFQNVFLGEESLINIFSYLTDNKVNEMEGAYIPSPFYSLVSLLSIRKGPDRWGMGL